MTRRAEELSTYLGTPVLFERPQPDYVFSNDEVVQHEVLKIFLEIRKQKIEFG